MFRKEIKKDEMRYNGKKWKNLQTSPNIQTSHFIKYIQTSPYRLKMHGQPKKLLGTRGHNFLPRDEIYAKCSLQDRSHITCLLKERAN